MRSRTQLLSHSFTKKQQRERQNERNETERRQRHCSYEYSRVFTKICMMIICVSVCVCVSQNGEKFDFHFAPFLGKMHPRAISSRHACDGTANACLSRPARRRQRGNNIFSRFRKRMTILRAEVHDAKANTGNGIGTNSRNTKRKEFTQKDVSKRLKRLREDLKNTNNTVATIPSETTVGTRFSEVLFKSKFVLKSLLNSLRLCLLSLFGFVLTSIEYSFV